MNFFKSIITRELDKNLAILGVLFSLILLIYLGREIYRPIYLIIGLLTLFSCLLWLVIRNNFILDPPSPCSQKKTKILMTTFSLLYLLSVLTILFRQQLYERPLLYFVLLALMTVIITYEIFTSCKQHSFLIYLQIILIGLSITWSQNLIFPSLLGVDPWTHSKFANEIITNSFIGDGFVYSKLPIFHLIISITSLIVDTNYKYAALLSVSFGQIICITMFVYLISVSLFKNYRIGLLASLMVTIANHHIYMSYWSIPNSFAAIFIPIIVYLIAIRRNFEHHFSILFLFLIFSATIILTHTITALCTLILLLVIWGIFALYPNCSLKNYNRISIIIPSSFFIGMLSWWGYASGNLQTLADLIKKGFSINAFNQTPLDYREFIENIPFQEQIINNLGMFLFFSLSFIGVLYLISQKKSPSHFGMAFIGMTPLGIGFFSLLSGISIIEHRWWYFAQIFLSMPLAIFIYFFGSCKNNYPRLLRGTILGLIFTQSFLMIISPVANIDNNYFSPNSMFRATLIESELELKTFLDFNGNPIKTDTYYASRLNEFGCKSKAFCKYVGDNNYMGMKGSLILIRETIMNNPFMFYTDIYKLNFNIIKKLNEYKFCRIYDSASVFGYY